MKNLLFLLFFFVAILAGCGGGGTVNTSQMSRQDFEASREVKNINSQLISQSIPTSSVTPEGYLIGPADLLEIKVFESEDLTTNVRVSSRGEITVPLLKNFYVVGLTAREAEVKMENLLREGQYIDDPHVSVFIAEHKSNVVSVMGYVNDPGVYELIGRRTLLDALAYAKGLTAEAGTLVHVARTENDETKNSYIVDLDELLASSNPSDNFEIKPGDLVYVPEASNIFVDGAVVNPGAYPINSGETTLSQTIVLAGGLMSIANGEVKLIRNLGNGRKEVLDYNLNSIREGGELDPLITESDAIIVGASGFKSFFYGFNINVWGLGGIGYRPPSNR